MSRKKQTSFSLSHFMVLMILYLVASFFLFDKNILQYLEISENIKKKKSELQQLKLKNEEIENNIELLNNKDADFAEELLKKKFNLKLKNEYVIYFKKK